MFSDDKIIIGKSEETDVYLYPQMANRHGIIAGATGTGKTTTVKVLAESFSDAGVPVFVADVKGDLAGISEKYPVNFWDLYNSKGLPLRTTITEMGPLLLARILELNDTQTEVLRVVFKIADDESLLLIDTKDLKAMLNYVAEKSKEYSLEYGSMSKQSITAIIRAVVALEAEGGDTFFGEPAVSITDWISVSANGKGVIQILDSSTLINTPKMYGTFMLWLISELFEMLPEVGDRAKPKMVFFFDEAHLLFNSASKSLLEKIEQTVKLIRSKGVGIYFITQNPKDIPDGVMSQLGNKIQHALHAYTPAEIKAAKAAAQSYRENPDFDTYETMTNLGTGEALVSVLDEEGVPTIVSKCKVFMPETTAGTISDEARDNVVKDSILYSKYATTYDRDSAYEFLLRRNINPEEVAPVGDKSGAEPKTSEKKTVQESAAEKALKRAAQSTAKTTAGTIGREIGNTVGKSVGGSVGKRLGGNIGASIGRGLLSTLFKL